MRRALPIVLGGLVLIACSDKDLGDEDDDHGSSTGPTCEDLGSSSGEAVASGSNSGQGNDFEPTCGDTGGEDVGFTWTVPTTGCWQFESAGTTYDTLLEVQEGSCGGPVLACDDDGGDDLDSRIQLELVEGDVVTVVLDAYSGHASGEYVLGIVPCAGGY